MPDPDNGRADSTAEPLAIDSMPAASAFMEAWQPIAVTLGTAARQGEVVRVTEFPWALAQRLLARVQTDLAPILRDALSAYSGLDALDGHGQAATVFGLVDAHAPALLRLPGLAEDLITSCTALDKEELDLLRTGDVVNLAGAALRVLVTEFAGVSRFFTSADAGVLAASPAGAPSASPT